MNVNVVDHSIRIGHAIIIIGVIIVMIGNIMMGSCLIIGRGAP